MTWTRFLFTELGALRGGRVVLVEQAAKALAAPDTAERRRLGGRRVRERSALRQRLVRSVLVVVPDVGAHDLLELAATPDQDPVEALAA